MIDVKNETLKNHIIISIVAEKIDKNPTYDLKKCSVNQEGWGNFST